MRHLPPPVTAADEYLAAALPVLDEINDRLGQILDRLPASARPAGAGAVELTEPAAQQAELTEPAAKPARTRKPAARKRTTTKTETEG